MARLLVTGGCGFIGRHVAEELLAHGHEVRLYDALIDQVHPQRVKQRQVAGTKRFLHTEIEKAKSLVFNARGDLRTERIGIVGGALAGAVTLLVVLRTVVRRHRG